MATVEESRPGAEPADDPERDDADAPLRRATADRPQTEPEGDADCSCEGGIVRL